MNKKDKYQKDPYRGLSNYMDKTNSKVDTLSEKVDSLTENFTQKLTQFKNEIITLLDKVMGELKAIREEQTVISGYKDQIEVHETRIGKLEEVLEPNPVSS